MGLKLDVAKDIDRLATRTNFTERWLIDCLFLWYLDIWDILTLDLLLHVYTQRYAKLFQTKRTTTVDTCRWKKERFCKLFKFRLYK